ncbi:hypothetical protein EDC04DRAFT_2598016 [Pisolithus marmoratus]|nr:hypothetical protein EDC04DRAFT_2598016 [Pisolithus marmoratus]
MIHWVQQLSPVSWGDNRNGVSIIIPPLKSIPTHTIPPAQTTSSTVGTINQPHHHTLDPKDDHTNHRDEPCKVHQGSISVEGDLKGWMANFKMQLDTLELWLQEATLGLLRCQWNLSSLTEVERVESHLDQTPTAQDTAMVPLDTTDTRGGLPGRCMDAEVAGELCGSGEAVGGELMQDAGHNGRHTGSHIPNGSHCENMSPPHTQAVAEPVLDCPIVTLDDGISSANTLDHCSQPTTFHPDITCSSPQPTDSVMQAGGQDPHPTPTSHSMQAEGNPDSHAALHIRLIKAMALTIEVLILVMLLKFM